MARPLSLFYILRRAEAADKVDGICRRTRSAYCDILGGYVLPTSTDTTPMNIDVLHGMLENEHFAFVFECLYDIYYEISNYISVQRLLPPLIMLLAVYLTILSLYRTTTFFIRTILFFVKWGGVIAIMAAGIGYFSKDSLSSNKPRRHRTPKPRVWDTFAEHQKWRNEETRPKEITDIIYEAIGQVADATNQFVDQGWRQTLSQFVLQAATKDTQDNRKKSPKSSKTVKGKAKSR